ncbi:hypothetical protein J6P92_01925 [bacterium]|nr:hypothetical protein [bacterium]
MDIQVKPNQTLKDFSYGRKFVRGFASRSIAPVMLLEAFVEGGRTYQAYQRGGFTEARERITEEFIGALFWFSGVPLFNSLIDKFVGKKVFKLPETDFDTGKDNLRNPVKNYISQFQTKLKKNPKQAEKMIAGYKFGKVMTSILLANCLVGLVLPKVNQAITKHLLRKKAEEKPQNKADEQNQAIEQYSIDKFINKDKDKLAFGSINPQTLMSLAYNFENNPKYGLISTDMGVWIGRGVSARNKYERNEVLFRDISSSYFYMFNMPVIAMLLNRLEDGKSHRLDPVTAKQVSDHMNEVLKAHGGTMTTDNFREFVLGNPENKAFLVPEISKELRTGKGVMELDKFIELLPHVKSRYNYADIEQIKKSARGMAELQPKLDGKFVISEKQIMDSFTNGAINMPEFLKNVYRCSTSDQNLFTGKISEANFNKDFSFISQDTFLKMQREMEGYVETIVKKAKDGNITKDIISKVCKENYIKNSINWGIGFAISAAFLSTFIPKIQYWMTRHATGSNEFPGTADYSEKN